MDIIEPTSIFDLSQEIEEGGRGGGGGGGGGGDFLIRLPMPAMV